MKIFRTLDVSNAGAKRPAKWTRGSDFDSDLIFRRKVDQKVVRNDQWFVSHSCDFGRHVATIIFN